MAAVVNYWPAISSGGGSRSAFETRMQAVLATAGASFTSYRYVPLGHYPASVTMASRTFNTTVGSGPGLQFTTGNTPAFTNNFVQTPKTLSWLIGYRSAVTGAFAGAQFAFAGCSDGATDFVRFGYAGASSNSFFWMDIGHGGATTALTTTVALDTNWHDHAVYYNGSTALTYYIDGVLVGTQSTLTNFPTTPQSLYAAASTNSIVLTEASIFFNEST